REWRLAAGRPVDARRSTEDRGRDARRLRGHVLRTRPSLRRHGPLPRGRAPDARVALPRWRAPLRRRVPPARPRRRRWARLIGPWGSSFAVAHAATADDSRRLRTRAAGPD